ncbi:MAG: hypothetical protein QOJ64_2921 [Acidobacteriota bacterium]|jgi:hypothetical protein|nr:hypothetical protein [Acidobacteriota bacterium]
MGREPLAFVPLAGNVIPLYSSTRLTRAIKRYDRVSSSFCYGVFSVRCSVGVAARLPS